ncbi:hypothetical protein WDJ50_02780 [Deinococcus sp. VB142]|uniref:Uncharacterized protein n=1 Tax=Deinococcus sp. VB142 TaxID=3112952 RepID=A0AAU6Q463_9DEIO
MTKPLVIRHHIPLPSAEGRLAVARAQRLLLARAEHPTSPTQPVPEVQVRNEQAEPDTAA